MLKTTILLASLTGLLVLIGDYFGGTGGMIIAFLFAIIMNFGSYWYSDKIVLKMYRAKEVSPAEAPNLHRIVDGLAMKAGIPKPKVYIVESGMPNAFATGRNPEHALLDNGLRPGIDGGGGFVQNHVGDVLFHSSQIGQQGRFLLRLKAPDQRLFQLVPVLQHNLPDSPRLRRQHDPLEPGILRHRLLLNQPLLLHQAQYLGCGGTGDGEVILNVPLVNILSLMIGKVADDPAVVARHALNLPPAGGGFKVSSDHDNE